MEFRILGPLDVRADGGALAVKGQKLRALLAVLLVHANRPVSSERVALALWGDDAPPGAVKTVQVHVSRLRKALGGGDVLETTPAGYRLVVGPDELDSERFQRELAVGRQLLASGEVERAAHGLRQALKLWRGVPLEEFAWAPFAAAETQRLEELHVGALEARLEADLAAGRHTEVVAELQRLTNEHPWRERLHTQLMLALYRSGRQVEALEAYRTARRLLVEQLGVEPGSELHDIHQAVLGHDAALNASRAPLGRLPTLPNRTIGRAGDVRSVVEKLRAGGMRLLTLTGPGGVGKTRLALEVARAVEADFADGAWFVSLAETAHAHDVAGAVVTTLGVVPLTGESAEEAVERFLAAKHLLLVIDNCEHLPAAAPFIGRLSVVGPGVKVLATSREPLAVQAERVHPVPPLALPDPGTEIDRRALAQSGAVALFCERARAHEDVDFELTGDNAGAIVEICRRVDGLPLAIELAAARCGLLSPAEIAVHLDVALRGLGTGPRDAPARQRTLRATLNWSHGLLDDEERAGFARFAVFAGGATVHAAEAVTGTSLDTLERLVAKSLLVRSRQARGPTRLAMLETVRAYAEERFAALADCDSIRERHFDHFLALARLHGTEQALHGHDRKEHLACLDGEVENLRAALGWAAGQHRGGQTLALSTALLDYWLKRDRYAEAVDWVMTALRTSDPMADAATRARALCKVCWALLAVGRAGEIAARLEDADEISRTLADPAIRAEVLYNHAALMGLDDRPDLAWPLAEEAVACADATGDSWLIAMTAWARVLASETPEQVRDSVKHAAPLLQRVGNIYHLACLFANATTWSACQGCDDDAAEYLRRAVPLVRELDDPSLWMLLRGDSGLLALAAGEPDAARDAFCDALGLSHDLVHLPALGDALTGLAAVAAVDEDVPRAARLAGAAAAHGVPDDSFAARLERTFLEPARARCTAAEWQTAAAEGAGLSLDQAIHYARQRPSSRPPALGGGRLRAIVPDAAGV